MSRVRGAAARFEPSGVRVRPTLVKKEPQVWRRRMTTKCTHHECRSARAAELAAMGMTLEAVYAHKEEVTCRRAGKNTDERCSRCGDIGVHGPVRWRCQVCKKLVCTRCTLTIPGSKPVEYYEQTLCSLVCWEKAGRPPR
jgi:hypothetical protein